MTNTTISFDRAAEIMGLKRSGTKSGADRAHARLLALFGTRCEKCGGTGEYGEFACGSYKCFGCGGCGYVVAAPTEATVRECTARVEAGELAGYFAHTKARASGEVWMGAFDVARMMVALFAEIGAFAASREPRCLAIESSHAIAVRAYNDAKASGLKVEMRRFGIPGTKRRTFEVWAV